MDDTTLSIYCKASDYDAVTQTCAAPFFGPAPGSLLPKLSATEGLELSVVIVGLWAIGYMIKSARRATST